jgi:hypothetical protein
MDTFSQRFRQEHFSPLNLAERYYAVLSALNNLKLTEREIQLVSFMAIKGSISFANVREEFCRKYSTSSPTINNMISKLKKLHILTKAGGKIKVTPIILLNFNTDVKLEISLVHRQATDIISEKLPD